MQLLQQNVNYVQIGVAKMQTRAFVAVKVEQSSGVRLALAFQIVRFGRGSCNRGHERIDGLDRVVHQQPALGNYVMAAAGLTAQQLDEVESLTDDPLVGVKAVIRDDDESGIGSHRTVLDAGPQATDHHIDVLQRRQM